MLDFVKNMSIGKKISALVGLTLFLMSCLITLSLVQIKAMGYEIAVIVQGDIQIVKALGRISVFHNKHGHHLEKTIQIGKGITQDKTEIERFKQERAKNIKYGGMVNLEIKSAIAFVEEKHWVRNVDHNSERALAVDYELRSIHKENADYQFLAERILSLISLSKFQEADAAIQAIEKEKTELEQSLERMLMEIETFTNSSIIHAEKIEQITMLGMLFISGFLLSISYIGLCQQPDHANLLLRVY